MAALKAHLLIPELVAMGYPIEICGFGDVDTQVTEMSSSWKRM